MRHVNAGPSGTGPVSQLGPMTHEADSESDMPMSLSFPEAPRFGICKGKRLFISDNPRPSRSSNIGSRRLGIFPRALRREVRGWPKDRVEVVDEDQGHSGQSVEGRLGFQYLLAEIGLDHVGIIFGLEMSRLARSNKDWHQLLELCAIFRTFLADQDGLYDPTDYHDRLLLGLKGTMSEAELHILRSRMYQGLLNKAKRGAVYNHPSCGYVSCSTGEFALDADEQVQSVMQLLVDVNREWQGTVHGLLRYLVQHGIRMPIRPLSGPNCGQLEWRVARIASPY